MNKLHPIIKSSLLITICLATMTTALAQQYPSIDYNRINVAYECRFELYVGPFQFTNGIIRPEERWETHEINEVINDVFAQYLKSLSEGRGKGLTAVANPDAMIRPFNRDIFNMRMALGTDNWSALMGVYNQAITDFTKNVVSFATPTLPSNKHLKVLLSHMLLLNS